MELLENILEYIFSGGKLLFSVEIKYKVFCLILLIGSE